MCAHYLSMQVCGVGIVECVRLYLYECGVRLGVYVLEMCMYVHMHCVCVCVCVCVLVSVCACVYSCVCVCSARLCM